MSTPSRMAPGMMAPAGADAALAVPDAALGAEARDWFALLKPRVLSLVVFTGLVGLLVAPGRLSPVLGFAAVVAITAAAGAAGAINMWYDRDIDALMRRTARRPIPTGRIEPGAALGFGVMLACASVLVMAFATNLVATGLLVASIGFYVFVYTVWLKRRTPQNIVIGGAAGAFPPLIGWAAVAGATGLLPWLMFAIIFLWTPPHFWSLSLFASDDYTRAGVPMLPVVRGARHTRWNVLIYSIVLLPVSLLPWALGCAGPIYGLAALVLGMGLIVTGWRVLRDRQDAAGISLSRDAPAKAAFRYSLLYLFVLFLALAVDHFVG